MQFAPSYNKRSNFGYSPEALSGYGSSPVMGASSHGRGRNSDNDDDDGDSSNFGPNFKSNFDGESSNDGDGDGDGSSANGDGQPMNLNQAASGYPNQGDYNNDAGFGAGFGFNGGASGFSPMGGEAGEAFGPSDGYEGDGRRAKSASSLMGSRNYGSDDDAIGGALQYGPNSAINSGERDSDDEARSGYAPEGQGDNENDDE